MFKNKGRNKMNDRFMFSFLATTNYFSFSIRAKKGHSHCLVVKVDTEERLLEVKDYNGDIEPVTYLSHTVGSLTDELVLHIRNFDNGNDLTITVLPIIETGNVCTVEL
jgi:hypothetical protein